jgi:hypothetical protein
MMALPMMQTPIYELTVPSTKKKVKFRPFLVKEEKALMIAQQSEDPQTMIDTLKQVISCCVKDIDIDKLALFDLEYIFLQLRAKSIGEISEMTYSCLECNDPKAKIMINLDLTEVNVEFHPEHTDVIDLFNQVGVKMKYPGVELLNNASEIDFESPDQALDMIASSIEYMFDGDRIYDIKDQPKEELIEFLENLTHAQLQKIKKFFDTMPKLNKKIEFNCPVCKFHHTQTLQGIQNFF